MSLEFPLWCSVLLCLRRSGETSNMALARDSRSQFHSVARVVSELQACGLACRFQRKARKVVVITDRGLEVARLLDELMSKTFKQ